MPFEIDPAVLSQLAISWGTNIIFALLIFIVGRMILGMVVGTAKRLMTKSNLDPTLVTFAGNILTGLGLAFVIIAALSQLGIETTSLAAAIAAAGLAIGLALQDSLSNFASGVLLILFKPFKNGDYVEAGGTAGTVEAINIFTTQLKTPDNKAVIVPNGAITSSNITNVTAKPTRRVDLTVGVSYNDDLAKVKAVLEGILQADDRILKDPAYTVAVSELADSSVNLVVRPWVKTGDYWNVYFDLTEKIKVTFDQEGISIPLPQQDIHVVEATALAKASMN